MSKIDSKIDSKTIKEILKEIPNASERKDLYKNIMSKEVEKKFNEEKKMFDNFIKIVVRWTKCQDPAFATRKKIHFPILKSIDIELYNQIKKELDEKGYIITITEKEIIISELGEK